MAEEMCVVLMSNVDMPGITHRAFKSMRTFALRKKIANVTEQEKKKLRIPSLLIL